MAPRLPIGIEILKGKTPKWQVGKELGSGACAAVHLLEELDGAETEWAIKLAPVPTKKTPKGNSEQEVNYRLLYHESVMYQNQFQDIQGIYVPRLPSYKGPPASGESNGYRFLTMEKMHSPLSALVPELLKRSKHSSASTIDFGPIAVQLLKCVQAIQDRKHVVVDIKPENFMLCSETPGMGRSESTAVTLASRIRILDLALVKMWLSIGSHRANEGTSTLEGTPMFASLNVHRGETPSRRDDLEALGYVIAELVMKLVSGNPNMELPWSIGTSDEEIGRMKTAQVENIDSPFYKQLGSPPVVKIIKDFLDTVRGYTYKQSPDYEQLVTLLSKLKVPTKLEKTSRKASKTTPTRITPKAATSVSGGKISAGTKRANGYRLRSRDESSDEESSPHKMARDENYMEIEEIGSIPNSQPYVAANPAQYTEGGEMDWEPVSDENQDPESDDEPKETKGVTIVVDRGPDKGAAVNLIQGRNETLVIGRNPVAKHGESTFSLPRDKEVDDSHIRIDLSITKKLTGVAVTDLKSSSGAFVVNDRIKKTYQIFCGQSVRIGNSVLLVKRLDAAKITASRQPGGTVVNSKKVTTPKRSCPTPAEAINVQKSPSSLKSMPQRSGLRICVVEGPHSGEEYELTFGVSESLIIGSKPSGISGATVMSLQKDTTLKPNHVHIKLFDHKKYKAVVVTDKSKGDLKVNRNKVKTTKAFVSDRITIGASVLQILPLKA